MTWNAEHRARGTVDGWFLTVPRSELRVFVNFARHAEPGATLISDCGYVADGVQANILTSRTMSAGLHADLWREAARPQAARGGAFLFLKIKAHRSRAKAASEAAGDYCLGGWVDNEIADECAK